MKPSQVLKIIILFILVATFAWAQSPSDSRPQFLDAQGEPYSGGRIYTYSPGTSTNQATYQDRTLSKPHTNPIVLGPDGRPPAGIYVLGPTKLVLKDSGGKTIWTQVWVGDDTLSWYNAGRYGTSGAKAAIDAALKAIGSSTATLYLPPATWNITDDLSLPPNVTLEVESGAVLHIADTKTLTINGPLKAGLVQIFVCSGTGAVNFGSSPNITEVYPEWWGAAGNGTADDTDEVNAAKNAVAGKKIWLKFLPGKTYAIDQLTIDTDNTKVTAYGSKLLHHGDNKALLVFDGSKAGANGLNECEWYGGTLVAKQSLKNPTTDVIYWSTCSYNRVKDVRIYCGTDGQKAFSATNPYADYGLRMYGVKGAGSYYNSFECIYIHGAKTAGIKFDGTTGNYVNSNGFIYCVILGNQCGVYSYRGGQNQFIGGDIEANNTRSGTTNIVIDAASTCHFIGTRTENRAGDDFDCGLPSGTTRSIFFGSFAKTPAEKGLKHFSLLHGYNDFYTVSKWHIKTDNSGKGGWIKGLMDAATNIWAGSEVVGDTNWRLAIQADGSHHWGDGANSADISLSRSSANVLQLAPGDALRLDSTRYNTLSAAPSDAVDGCVAYDDGHNWGGQGEGLYYRGGNAWHVIPRNLNGAIVWDPGNLADGAGETSSGINVTGAVLGDFVMVAAPYDLQDLTVTGYVQAADTVKIRLQNKSGGAVDLAAGTWKVRVIK